VRNSQPLWFVDLERARERRQTSFHEPCGSSFRAEDRRDMNASELRERMTKNLLDEIAQVHYPSVTMLNRAERTLTSREALADYAEVLVRKVEATRFPSLSLLNRVDELIARLENAEQQGQDAPGG
jgi:hypothetical protein